MNMKLATQLSPWRPMTIPLLAFLVPLFLNLHTAAARNIILPIRENSDQGTASQPQVYTPTNDTAQSMQAGASDPCTVSIYCKNVAKYDLINIFRGHLLDIGKTARYTVNHDIACHLIKARIPPGLFEVGFEYCLFGQGGAFPREGVGRDLIEKKLRQMELSGTYGCGCVPLGDTKALDERGFLKIDYVNHAVCEGACTPDKPGGGGGGGGGKPGEPTKPPKTDQALPTVITIPVQYSSGPGPGPAEGTPAPSLSPGEFQDEVSTGPSNSSRVIPAAVS